METSGFLSGVPLGSVKNARFLNLAGTFFTLAKLILNGVAYEFTAATDGAVIMSADSMTWKFIAPDGRFDMDALTGMSAVDALRAMAAICDATPVPAWDDFAVWISNSDKVNDINLVLSSATSIMCGELTITNIPTFTAPGEHISGLLNWLANILEALETEWLNGILGAH